MSLSQDEFATELCCCRENIKCVDGLVSSVHTADTTAVQRVMSRLRLSSAAVSSSRKEAHSGSTGCWFHLRNHLSGWPCLTEPETDCVKLSFGSAGSDSPLLMQQNHRDKT